MYIILQMIAPSQTGIFLGFQCSSTLPLLQINHSTFPPFLFSCRHIHVPNRFGGNTLSVAIEKSDAMHQIDEECWSQIQCQELAVPSEYLSNHIFGISMGRSLHFTAASAGDTSLSHRLRLIAFLQELMGCIQQLNRVA